MNSAVSKTASVTIATNELPEGWAQTELGTLCAEVQYGWTTSAKSGAGLKLLRTTDISNGRINWATVPSCQEEPPNIQKYALRPGDIVVSRAGSIGLSHLVRECPPAVFASYLIRLRANPAALPEFLAVFLDSPAYWKAISDESAGIAIPNINASKLRALEVPFPPLAEQTRIVQAIERLTARVDAARERLAKVRAILKRFRQSVLAAACSGRLTEDWRGARPNSSMKDGLLHRVEESRRKLNKVPWVDGVSDDLEGPEGWEPIYFGNLLTNVTSGSRGWAKYYANDGPLFIRSQDINTDYLDLRSVAHVNPPVTTERDRTRVQKGDVLITITGANVTKCAVVNTDIEEAYVSQHVSLSRLALPQLAPFVHLWMVSPQHGRKVLLDAAYGAGKPGLNLDNIKEVLVAVPSLEEQGEIVRRVEALMNLANAIEQRIGLASARADKTTQAILAKAFRGELVPTEADLARAEDRDYEPADKLLARIQSTNHSVPTRHPRANGRVRRRPTR